MLTRAWLCAMHAAGCDEMSISLVAQTRSQSILTKTSHIKNDSDQIASLAHR